MKTIDRLESRVRSYCRSFPAVFATASGARLTDVEGRDYIDFFAGAGTLNYGHDEPFLRQRLLDYVADGGIVHSLDLATEAKIAFLEAVESRLLKPRDLDYRVMFPGPTGTNAVEAALKLARKVTGRTNVIAFTNAFHGMTAGSLAVSGRGATSGTTIAQGAAPATRIPFDGYHGSDVDTAEHLERLLDDPSGGVAPPAAILVETVQGEGGVNVASMGWLRRIAAAAERCGALLVVDDIQVGCGRTGPFFSFEPAEIEPDIVCLSKSLSGYGLPFAAVLLRPEHDCFEPGEHNGTFRGHNLAFVTATAALERYWSDDALSRKVGRDARRVRTELRSIADTIGAQVRGRGLIQGLVFDSGVTARAVSARAFELGLIAETSGPKGEVLKLLPPLTIDGADLELGLHRLRGAVAHVEAHGTNGVAMAATNGSLS